MLRRFFRKVHSTIANIALNSAKGRILMGLILFGGYYISQDTPDDLLMDFKISHEPLRNESEGLVIRNPIHPNEKIYLTVTPAF